MVARLCTSNGNLKRAGVPKEALEIIPDMVDTCGACRTWSQPLPQSVASVNIPDIQ